MRWKKRKVIYPKENEIRFMCKFAWKPIEIDDTVVWLERYAVTQVFFQPVSGAPGWWRDGKKHLLLFGH